MFEKVKARILFEMLLKRPDIEKAYAMVGPEDSWYATISKVHESLAEIKKLPHETVQMRSFDGLTLKGIYYPAAQASDVTVICAHGYTSHAEREWAFPGLFYHSLGYNVLIPYQRAHGISEGKYLTFCALEQRDMMGWVELINHRNPAGSILLHGLSMGGGIVLTLADKEMKNVKGIVADAPSTGVEDFIRGVAGHVFKAAGPKVAECTLQLFNRTFGVKAADCNIHRGTAGSRYDLFLCAGSTENLEELFASLEKANPMETEILILPGCAHGNGMYKQTELYQGRLKAFAARCVQG